MITKNNTAGTHGEAYRYRNVRPLATFGFAGMAAIGALALVAGAHSALVAATRDNVIGDPPDLRKVIVKVEDRTGISVPGMQDRVSATKGETTVPDTLAARAKSNGD